MSLPTPRALADHGMDFGPTPRLRSLRIVQESRDSTSAEGLTPSMRYGSLPESEKSPLHTRMGNPDASSKHGSVSQEAKWGWRQVMPIAVLLLFLAAAAMAVFSSHSSSGSTAIEGLHKAQRTLEREVGATFSSQQRVAKGDSFVEEVMKAQAGNQGQTGGGETVADNVAGLYDVFAEDDITADISGEDVTEQQHDTSGSMRESEELEETSEVGFFITTLEQPKKRDVPHTGPKTSKVTGGGLQAQTTSPNASLQSNATNQPAMLSKEHLRIFVADVGPKYNIEIFEAVYGLEDSLSEGTSMEDLVASPLSLHKGSELLDIPSHHLDVVLHALVMDSSLRTTNASEADIVWVPFWVHKLVRLDQEIEKPNKYDLAEKNFWNEVDRLLPLLGKKPHILVVPGQEAELRSTCGGFGIGFLCHHRASQLTILSPEIFLGKKADDGISMAVPDVANVHIEAANLTQKFDAKVTKALKTKLISEAFRSRAAIRKVLKTQCTSNPQQCSHAEPSSRLSNTAFSKAVHENDMAAWFSLQPPGDTNVRLPFFNCLLSEAIPVAFDSKLHSLLPFGDHIKWQELLVQVSPDSISSSQKKQITDILKEFTVEARLARLSKIHDIRALMQYQAQPNVTLVRFDALGARTSGDDAFSMLLKTLMQTLCRHKQLPLGRCSPQERAHKEIGHRPEG